MSKKAFTLVELMIVIAIIGILAAALFPAMSGYLARSRDTQRITDTTRIETASNLYITDTGVFPGETFVTDTSCGSSNIGITNFACEVHVTASTGSWDSSGGAGKNFYGFKNYLGKLPVDPLNRGEFFYQYEPINAGDEHCIVQSCRFIFTIHLENIKTNTVGSEFASNGNGWYTGIFGQKQK